MGLTKNIFFLGLALVAAFAYFASVTSRGTEDISDDKARDVLARHLPSETYPIDVVLPDFTQATAPASALQGVQLVGCEKTASRAGSLANHRQRIEQTYGEAWFECLWLSRPGGVPLHFSSLISQHAAPGNMPDQYAHWFQRFPPTRALMGRIGPPSRLLTPAEKASLKTSLRKSAGVVQAKDRPSFGDALRRKVLSD